jgi:hypothetical protein
MNGNAKTAIADSGCNLSFGLFVGKQGGGWHRRNEKLASFGDE